MDMKKPTTLKQLQSFLDMVTFYRDMWPWRLRILAPLTNLLGTKKYIWSQAQDQAFSQMKSLIICDTFLMFPDPNKPYIIKIDASEYQLCAVIKQYNDKHQTLLPIAYYSHKLNSAQQNYSTIEQEVLSIIELFKEFCQLLYGAKIQVHTDHKNPTHTLFQFTTQQVLHWHLLLEDFNPQVIHIQGKKDVLADALSRALRRQGILCY